MIGLGSNRLSVCRRGGMSVTQAGRGGMEWLAGGRVPDWITPYSAQATAALKAAFPTQWPTIRYYGFAHPEIVPYVNAYAPEDAKIAYSLVEGIGTRWLVGDGNAYIQSGLVMKDINYQFELDTQWNGSNARQFATYFGFMSPNNGNCPRIGLHNYTGKIMFGTNYTNTTNITLDSNRWIYSYKANTGDVLRKSVGGSFTLLGSASTDSNYFSANDLQVYIFARNYNGFNNGMAAKISYLSVTRNGELAAKYVPFISRTEGLGMMEIVSGSFKKKQGSGSFTISETPAA